MTSEVQDESTGREGESAVLEGLQPFLHDAVITLYAPGVVIARPGGDLAGGADGWFQGDRRLLSRLTVRAEGIPLIPVAAGAATADESVHRAVLRGVGEHTADPAVTLRRARRVEPDAVREELRIDNAGVRHVTVRLVAAAGTDLSTMPEVKDGRPRPEAPATAEGGALVWRDGQVTVRLTAGPGGIVAAGATGGAGAPGTADGAGGAGATARSGAADGARAGGPADGAGLTVAGLDAAAGEFAWLVRLAPRQSWRAELVCSVEDRGPGGFPSPPRGTAAWRTPEVRTADHRMDVLLRRSVADLERLLLADPLEPRDLFLAAGAPWFLTLFGRDALWAARMLLPLGTGLAAGTLRTLARRQGQVSDPRSQEAPGKILHEVRRETWDSDRLLLPATYFGTVDATPLWVILLHDAWRWGMPQEEVEALLPHAEAALEWLAGPADADGDGLLEYVDTTGRGLANQGWRDSGDSIRFRNGALAEPPIVLSEMQSYAHEAAVAGAALLSAFGRPGADRWLEWAERLRTRFRAAFWVRDAAGRYPAIALDRDKRPADAVTSGFGHLLGSGLLDAEESALLAARLAGPDLDSGFGLRTFGTGNEGFNPLGYHIGSVWPHDTAIAVHGLVRAGFPGQAASLAQGLINASPAFDARLPELYSGHSAAAGPAPCPYPASCRPQAWSAAASVQLLSSVLGLTADVPGGVLRVDPAAAGLLLPLRADGLSLAGHPLSVEVRADGTATVRTTAPVTVHGCG